MAASSGIRARPSTARPRSRTPSHSSKSNVLTPSPPVATNRTTQLRHNARNSEEWMLKETREYLDKGVARRSKQRLANGGQ